MQNTFKETTPGKPLVTIITVIYNGERFLEKTIQSVIDQDYESIEYIIIDGGSTDRTLDIINKYDNVIDYWRSEEDGGIYDAMNKGIRLARGELIGLINCDDYYMPNIINYIACFFKNNPADVIFGNKIAFEERLGFQKLISVPVPTCPKDMSLHIVHPSVFVKKEVYFTDMFNYKYKVAADYDFFLRLLDAGFTFAKVDRALAVMRLGGASSKLNLESVFIKNSHIGFWSALLHLVNLLKTRVFNKLLDSPFFSDKLRAKVYLSKGWRHSKL